MDRDEAIARGLRVHETQHSMKRRSPWHDYHGRGTYMLTLVVEGRMPLLGKLWGRVDARPGDGDAPKVMLSELGIAIAKEEIPKIHKYYPQVEVWRVCIMPDHIHLIVRVKEDLRGGQAMESLGTEARGGQASALTKEANFRARVKEVIISAEGYFFVEAETDSTPIVPILHKDHWKEWEPPLPLFPMTEEFLCVEDATMMMIDILRHETLTSDEEEELQEYTETLITMGKYALWYEAKEGIENVIKAMEAKKGDKMRYMANELEHLLSGLCNEGRQKKLRKSWLPHLLSTHEAERAWHDWLHLKGADCHKPDNLKMMLWLEDIETELSNIPALAPYSNDDKIAMLIRAHYTRIPLDKYRQLLTAFVIRDRLRMRLGLPTNSFAPTPSLTSQKEDYLIDKIIKYSQTLVRREDVEVLQRFIYHEISYLPPEYKLRVDNMTERFLSEEAREGIQINAIKEQTKALKEVAKKPTIQAEHYHAGNSTFDVHSKHLHLDHQEEGNSALLPSEL